LGDGLELTNYTTIDNGKELVAMFKVGFSFAMYNDSKILRSLLLLEQVKISKWLMSIGELQCSACNLIDECEG
jgi:hypothetical protein